MTSDATAPGGSAGVAPLSPTGLLAELTHRCPLQCPYCSNPLALETRHDELSAAEWVSVLEQAAALGVLHVHLSGGEPASRRDLEAILTGAVNAGLYTNLITSGVGLPQARLRRLKDLGLDHVQISVQDTERASCDRIAGYDGAFDRKLALARDVRELGLPLTLNAPMHRQNLERLDAMIALAVELGARRLEVANVQYYGWALANRAALMPTRDEVRRSLAVVQRAREVHKGVLAIDFVAPDYYARRPKPCVGGWGRAVIVVTPSGKVLPCHAAETIPGLTFERVRDRSLAEIWNGSAAFQAFRGTEWMREPCRSCELKAKDWGGCRCQALAITGDAGNADPACDRSAWHADLIAIAEAEAGEPAPPFRYRRYETD